MHRKVGLQAFVLVVVVVLLGSFVAGCGARPSQMPVAASTPWIASLLGRPAHASVVIRPASFLRDPYWGPAMQRALAKPSRSPKEDDDIPDLQAFAFLAAEQIEMFMVMRDLERVVAGKSDDLGSDALGYVFVVRRLPVTDPMRITTRRGEPIFAAPTRLASGVLEYPPAPAYAQRKRGLAARLFIMPDGTWVGVDHGTAPRAHAIYTQTPVAPPPVTLEEDGLMAAAIQMDAALMAVASRRSAAEAADPTWLRDIRGAGVALRGGKKGAVEVTLEYANDEAAGRTKTWMDVELKAACRERSIVCAMVKTAIRDVETSKDGHRVGVSFFFSEALLATLAGS